VVWVERRRRRARTGPARGRRHRALRVARGAPARTRETRRVRHRRARSRALQRVLAATFAHGIEQALSIRRPLERHRTLRARLVPLPCLSASVSVNLAPTYRLRAAREPHASGPAPAPTRSGFAPWPWLGTDPGPPDRSATPPCR